MISGKEDLLQSLIEAFLMEKGTNEFYLHASQKTADASAKKTFQELSDWEESHMEYIKFLYQSLQEDHDLKGFGEFQSKTDAPLTEAGIPVKILESRVESYAYTDDRDALNLALEIEGKAYNLYRRLSEQAADSNARVVFKEMMDQELKHIDYLKAKRSTLA